MTRNFALTFVFCLASSNYAVSQTCNPEVCATNLSVGLKSCSNPGLGGATVSPERYQQCIHTVQYRYKTCVKYWCHQ
jgi:hypothetical protein